MKDGIIKGDGTSRFMRSTLPATYEESKTLAEQGKLPMDVLFNADGWSQQPDFLNKKNLLTDATAALYGLEPTAVPDDVFSSIHSNAMWVKLNEYTAQPGTPTVNVDISKWENGINYMIVIKFGAAASQRMDAKVDYVDKGLRLEMLTYRDTLTVDHYTGMSFQNVQANSIRSILLTPVYGALDGTSAPSFSGIRFMGNTDIRSFSFCVANSRAGFSMQRVVLPTNGLKAPAKISVWRQNSAPFTEGGVIR